MDGNPVTTMAPTLQVRSGFRAYNDLSWAPPQILDNTTFYTSDADGEASLRAGPSGPLKSYCDGSEVAVNLTVTGGLWIASDSTLQGVNAALGTDAHSIFGDIVDSIGVISYGPADEILLQFDSLDPARRYEVVVFGNRGEPTYTTRRTIATLQSADAFANESSAGALFAGASDPTVDISNGFNTNSGHVARFTAIDPGADGSVSIALANNTHKYTSAVMIQTGVAGPRPENRAPSVAAGAPQYVQHPTQVSLSGAVFDDGVTSPLTFEWTKLSGPGRVIFADASALNTTADFSLPGTYRLRLGADDGERTAFDTTVVVASGSDTTRFAVIGNYGHQYAEERFVANLVRTFYPEYIVTLGDNNHPDGAADTIDEAIGKYYAEFISPYTGGYGPGAAFNRFFPVLGEHDWTTDPSPYFNYFELPGNERYYQIRKGPAELFILNSNSSEPDGMIATSAQAAWLENALATSTAPFKFVFLHHPPHSSTAAYGSYPGLRWPFEAWGVDAVFAAHNHIYDRLERDDNGDTVSVPYFINGVDDVVPEAPVRHGTLTYPPPLRFYLAARRARKGVGSGHRCPR